MISMNAEKRSGVTLTDNEIREYLESKNWEIDATDAVMNIMNTSDQIISAKYNIKSSEMILITPDNIFKFKWKLKNYSGGIHD